MPRNATPGRRQINLELPADLADRFDALAKRTGRTRTQEAILAFERHLAYPPPTMELTQPLNGKGNKKSRKRV